MKFGTWIAIDDQTGDVVAEGNLGQTYGQFQRSLPRDGRSRTITNRGDAERHCPQALARWDARS